MRRTQSGYPAAETEADHQLFLKAAGQKLREGHANGVEIKGNGHKLPVYESQDLMHIRIPLRKTAEIFPHPPQIRMKNMSAVLVDANMVMIIKIITVAAYMRPRVNEQRTFPELFGQNTGGNGS